MSDLRECVTGETLVWLADEGGVHPRARGSDSRSLGHEWRIRNHQAQSDLVWSKGVRQVFRMALASGVRCARLRIIAFLRETGGRRSGEIGPGSRAAVARNSLRLQPVVWSDAEISLWGTSSATAAIQESADALHHVFGSQQSIGRGMRLGAWGTVSGVAARQRHNCSSRTMATAGTRQASAHG